MFCSKFFLILCILFDRGICAQILGVFTVPSVSHQIMFQAICKELSLRGHNVTFISANILNDSSIKNLKEIDVNYVYDIHKMVDVSKILSKNNYLPSMVTNYYFMGRFPAEMVFEDPNFQDLYKSDEKFDVVLLQAFHPLTFAITTKFRAPIIGESAAKFYLAITIE